MKWYKILMTIIFAIGISLLITFLGCRYKLIEVNNPEATIRVPGEFEDEIKVLYNEKYIKYTTENSVIKLNFLKPGYYHLSIMGKKYVFHYNSDLDSNLYDIDLISQEFYQIDTGGFIKWFVPSIVITSIVILIIYFIFLGINAIKNKKGKFPKIKLENTSKEEL